MKFTYLAKNIYQDVNPFLLFCLRQQEFYYMYIKE